MTVTMDQSAKQVPASTRIFTSSPVETKDVDEERLERGNNLYLSITKGLSDREAHDAMNVFVSKGPAQHKDIQYGLLYNILVEPVMAPKSFQDMLLVSRDGLNTVVAFVINVVSAKWLRFLETPKGQIVWLTRELVKQNVKDADELYLLLLRQVVGGDLSSRNIWLAESMLDMFVDQVLAHLDHMRQVCRNISFLNHEHIQHALQQVQATATDSQKSKFSDLLALAEDIEDIRTTRVLRGRRGANSSPKMVKSKRPVDSDSNSDIEEEESNLRHPPKKKKKIQQPALDDDSD